MADITIRKPVSEIKVIIYDDNSIAYEMLDGTISDVDPNTPLHKMMNARKAEITFRDMVSKFETVGQSD